MQLAEITPIQHSKHRSLGNPYIMMESRKVRIVSDDFQTALLGYDHKSVPLLNAREVRIEMSDKHVRFARYRRYSYLKRLRICIKHIIIKILKEDVMAEIFVYGTLLEGCRNYLRYLDGHVHQIMPAYVKGTLYSLKGRDYPALLPGSDFIRGEVMEADDEVIPAIDQLEGYVPGSPDNEYEKSAHRFMMKKNSRYARFRYMCIISIVRIKEN